MVRTTIDDNPTLTSPSSGTYAQVSVYSSVRDADSTLRMIVVNRSLTG